jgi:hypothetical protein
MLMEPILLEKRIICKKKIKKLMSMSITRQLQFAEEYFRIDYFII